MALFNYQARDAQGGVVRGELEAPTRRDALHKLKTKGLQVTAIAEEAGSTTAGSSELASSQSLVALLKAKAERSKPGPKRRIRGADSVALDFLKKLRQLHGSGLAVGDAIRTLSLRLNDARLKAVATNLWRSLSEGQPLAAAIKQHPEVFDPTLVYLIEAGESTGHLLPVLDNIIELLEGKLELRRKVLSGLAYPAFICTIAVGVVALFIFYLLPRIESMMNSLGGELSFSARLLVWFSHFALAEGPWIVLAIIIAVIVITQWRKTDKGKRITDQWALRIPIFKNILLNTELCRVSNLMSTLLGSGVNTTETLRLTERALRNTALVEAFQDSRTLINDGASFYSAFRKNPIFPPLALDILSVGENTGNLTGSFKEIYSMQSRELTGQLKFMTGFVSSAALGFAFALVAILTLGIVTSILQLSQSLQR